MEAQGEFPVEFDEAQAKSIWYSTPLRCIEQLFLFRLYPMHPEDGEGLYSDGDSLLNMQLPCGHDVSIRKVNIVALTGESLATQQCPAWGARILQPADDGELLLGKQAELTESWRASSSTWQALDRITPSSSKLYKFSTTAILHAPERSAGVVQTADPRQPSGVMSRQLPRKLAGSRRTSRISTAVYP